MGLRRQRARGAGVRRRRPLPRELDSGTTGLPKCVHAQPEPVVVLPPARRRAGALHRRRRVHQRAARPVRVRAVDAHFTPAVLGCADGACTSASTPTRRSTLIERERVTVLGCVSTQFIMMLNSPELAERDLSLAAVHVHRRRGGAVRAGRASSRTRTGATRAAVLRLERDRRAQPHHDATTTASTACAPPAASSRRCRCACSTTTGADVTAPGVPGQPGVQGPGDLPRLLRRRRGQRRAVHRRRLDADGRHRRRSTPRATSRVVGPHVRHHHPRRQEHQRARGRGRGRHAPRRRDGGRGGACPTRCSASGCASTSSSEPGTTLDLDDARRATSASAACRKEWFPEHLVVLDELPAPSGGKVAKGELRARNGT